MIDIEGFDGIKIWSQDEMNDGSVDKLKLADMFMAKSDISVNKDAKVVAELRRYLATPTCNRLQVELNGLFKLGGVLPVVIIPVSKFVGGGFQMAHIATNGADFHPLLWPWEKPYYYQGKDRQAGHYAIKKRSVPANARINPPKDSTYKGGGFPSGMVLWHELGHVYQCWWDQDKFQNDNRDGLTLDAYNVSYIERNFMIESRSPKEFIVLRDKYNGNYFSTIALDPGRYGYGNIIAVSSHHDLRWRKDENTAYDPLNPANLLRREETVSAEGAVKRYAENGTPWP